MQTLRRRFASCALALMLVQAGLLLAAPLASCCPSRSTASAAAEKDCCPAGSHAPGECPLHSRGGAAKAKAACRMQCDSPHGIGLLVVVTGVLPGGAAASLPLMQSESLAISRSTFTFRTLVPDSPPPRLL